MLVGLQRACCWHYTPVYDLVAQAVRVPSVLCTVCHLCVGLKGGPVSLALCSAVSEHRAVGMAGQPS